ncbi:hypothetical protein [Caulobacter segnis]|uniref:Uncharacterized protein n=1 Tax=Caulobacter segnis TaxID=88688 RepID=A0A2W5VN91_9CAUL|nr:hypothetical protein [Caulobacter segnis]PZR36785.1 MAG: hypothetical protein DI526_02245 [Caulobacter segnis]
MSNVRPAGWPVVPSQTPSVPAKTGAATRAAFFQAALTEAAPARPAAAPSTVQLQAQAQPQQRAAPQKPFVQPDAQPQKILRPGSLLNILV